MIRKCLYLFLFILLYSCSGDNTGKGLVQADSLIAESSDTAYSILHDYKKAEENIRKVNNKEQNFKVYEGLFLINYKVVNLKAIEYYSRKELQLSSQIAKPKYKYIAFSHVALSMIMIYHMDSANYYMDKIKPLIPYLSREDQAAAYNNLASFYREVAPDDIATIKKYLYKSLRCKPTATAKVTIAELYLESGNESKALILINQLLKGKDNDVKAILYNDLSQYYNSCGDISAAYAYHNKCDSIKEIIQTKLEKEKYTELQLKYDNEVVKNKSAAEKSKLIRLILLIIIASLIATVFFLSILKKKNRYISKIVKQLDNINGDIERLKSKGNIEFNRQTNALQKKLSFKQKQLSGFIKDLDSIQKGIQIFYYLMDGDDYKLTDNKDRNDFIACCRLLDESFVKHIEHLKGERLTIQDELFCILHHLNKKPEEIQEFLGISKEALRKTKERTLIKLRKDPSFKKMADNIATL